MFGQYSFNRILGDNLRPARSEWPEEIFFKKITDIRNFKVIDTNIRFNYIYGMKV